MNWWDPCPNAPPCPHGALVHDITEPDDPSPTCCVEGCGCGQSRRSSTLEQMAALVAQWAGWGK